MQRPRGCRARGAFPELQEERKEARKVGRHRDSVVLMADSRGEFQSKEREM